MKVINIISDTNIGGAGKCLLSYIDNYDKTQIDLEVFIPFKSELRKELKLRNVTYTEVENIDDVSFNFQAVKAIHKLFKEIKPDIVHTHATMSGRVAAKLYGKCKIINTRHSVYDQPKKLKKFPRKFINGLINNFFSDKIIAVSPAAKQNIVEVGANPNKIEVIYNGVDAVERVDNLKKIEIRSRYGITPTEFVVSIIGRLEDIKGHEYVIEAAEILQKKEENIKILIAGTGSKEKSIKDVISLKQLGNVVMTGFIHEINEIENITDLQINASYGTEATSLSLLEGFSLGIPAVVSDFGGNPFVVIDGFNGLVYTKKSTDGLVKGILKIYNDNELYTKLSKGAFEDFDNRFTSYVMTKMISDLYFKMYKGDNYGQ